jgi:hypothetical protein
MKGKTIFTFLIIVTILFAGSTSIQAKSKTAQILDAVKKIKADVVDGNKTLARIEAAIKALPKTSKSGTVSPVTQEVVRKINQILEDTKTLRASYWSGKLWMVGKEYAGSSPAEGSDILSVLMRLEKALTGNTKTPARGVLESEIPDPGTSSEKRDISRGATKELPVTPPPELFVVFAYSLIPAGIGFILICIIVLILSYLVYKKVKDDSIESTVKMLSKITGITFVILLIGQIVYMFVK